MRSKVFIILALTLLLTRECKNVSPAGEKGEPTARNWVISGFEKADSINPILGPSPGRLFFCPLAGKEVRWEEKNVLNPTAVVRDGKIFLIYRAQDRDMTSRLGLAVSDDGLHFTKLPAPVLYPGNDSLRVYEWKGGVEDPRIVESEDSTYILTYTAYDGKTARLCLATSEDLVNWKKHGPVLGEGKRRDVWSKSGAIVSRLVGNRVIATKIGGKYWMYFGDTDLFMATSPDLIHWDAIEKKETGSLLPVLNPRPGYFDSRLVEPGPFALLTEVGIVLIYNSSNAGSYNDTVLPEFAYAAGQALFDRDLPFRLIDRTTSCFIFPDRPYEKTGEVNNVCFVEGLVSFKNKMFLYYGTADSKIAVAVSARPE